MEQEIRFIPVEDTRTGAAMWARGPPLVLRKLQQPSRAAAVPEAARLGLL
jgi:hypothetical protein